MKITLISENHIRLEPVPGPLTIEADAAETQYSPFHMLASSLATCTFSVIYSWATHAKLSVDDLAIDVRWQFGEDPHRVSKIDIALDWKSLPANRRSAAHRVAEMCTVHATLIHPPEIVITADAGDQEGRAAAIDAAAGGESIAASQGEAGSKAPGTGGPAGVARERNPG